MLTWLAYEAALRLHWAHYQLFNLSALVIFSIALVSYFSNVFNHPILEM